MSAPEAAVSGKAPEAVVFGCSGPRLTADEAALFRDADPLGFILFARNVETPDQVRALCDSLRTAVGRDDAPILIDQEGGRVRRLRPPHWRDYPPMQRIGDLARRSLEDAVEAAWLVARLIADDLRALGIDVDCAPVLDLPAPDGHEIIGDRAFSDDPEIIARLGRAVCDGLAAGAVMPIVKHIPGHGRATADSHKTLPHVDASVETLAETDFRPFRALSDAPAAMTAHVVYEAFDASRPGSASPAVIDGVIRGLLGFDGFLFSDDVCMKALSGPLDERVAAVLGAGCDAALHCDGDFGDMQAIARTCPELSPLSRDRWTRARARCNDSETFDRKAAESRFSALLGV